MHWKSRILFLMALQTRRHRKFRRLNVLTWIIKRAPPGRVDDRCFVSGKISMRSTNKTCWVWSSNQAAAPEVPTPPRYSQYYMITPHSLQQKPPVSTKSQRAHFFEFIRYLRLNGCGSESVTERRDNGKFYEEAYSQCPTISQIGDFPARQHPKVRRKTTTRIRKKFCRSTIITHGEAL